jgi:hypothetical protein
MDGYDLSEFFADDNVSFVHTFAAHTQTIPSLQDSFLAAVSASTRLNSSAKKILQTVTVTRDSLVFKMLFSIPVRTVGTKSTITLSEHDLRDRWNGSIASSVVKTPDPRSVLIDFFGNIGAFNTPQFLSTVSGLVTVFNSKQAVKLVRNMTTLSDVTGNGKLTQPNSPEEMRAFMTSRGWNTSGPQDRSQSWIAFVPNGLNNDFNNDQRIFEKVSNHLAAMNGCWLVNIASAKKCKVKTVTCNLASLIHFASSPFDDCESCADFLGIADPVAQSSGAGNNWGSQNCPSMSLNHSNSINISSLRIKAPLKGNYNNAGEKKVTFFPNLYPSVTVGDPDPAKSPCTLNNNKSTDSCAGPAGSACDSLLFNVEPGTTLKCVNGDFWLAMADVFPSSFMPLAQGSSLDSWLSFFFIFLPFVVVIFFVILIIKYNLN